MMHEFELTDEEYRAILNALKYAKENAVHEDSRARFGLTIQELVEQYEESPAASQ